MTERPAGHGSPVIGLGLLALGVLLIYGPDVGHGFIKDDFWWIDGVARRPLWQALIDQSGFFRPLVTLTFALDHHFYGLRPWGYGLTNLILLLAATAAVRALARALGLGPGAAVAAATLWVLNPHGINMAVLWVSGRTALLLVLFSTLAAERWLSGRRGQASLLALLALFSKEEAVVLPALLTLWTAWEPAARRGVAGARPASALWRAWPMLAVLGVYFVLRAWAGSMTPWTAPAFYRFTFQPWAVLVNAAHYLDRGATFVVATVLLAALVMRRAPRIGRAQLVVMTGLIWFAAGYALTVFVPVRSSLYACLPSVGAALAGAAILEGQWRDAPARRPWQALLLAIVVGGLLLPVYHGRNHRWSRLADLSRSVLDDLQRALTAAPRDIIVVVRDDRRTRRNLDSAFGTLFEQAVRLTTGKDVTVRMDPPPIAVTHAEPPSGDAHTRRCLLALAGDHLVTLEPCGEGPG